MHLTFLNDFNFVLPKTDFLGLMEFCSLLLLDNTK